jgi:hypothetical protein
VLDLAEEIDAVRDELTRRGIDYAVCGGIAMAIHGFTRATEDLDLFIRPEDYARVKEAVAARGFTFEALPMSFSSGMVEIRRVSKVDRGDGDVLMIDLLLVTPNTEDVWENRTMLTWRGKPFPVVSREGLIKLKKLRGSDLDLVDIRRLEEAE